MARSPRIALWLLVLIVCLAGSVGCTPTSEPAEPDADTPAASAEATSTQDAAQDAADDVETSDAPADAEDTVDPAPDPEPEPQVLAPGGHAHTGETIYVMIVASEDSKVAAEAKAETARGALGEFETYFIVDESDHYDGMAPGFWVVFEPYATLERARDATQNDAAWLKAYGITPYMKTVTVRCADSFPLVR